MQQVCVKRGYEQEQEQWQEVIDLCMAQTEKWNQKHTATTMITAKNRSNKNIS